MNQKTEKWERDLLGWERRNLFHREKDGDINNIKDV